MRKFQGFFARGPRDFYITSERMNLEFANLIDAGVLDHLIHAPQRCCSLWCGRESKVFLSLRAPRLAFGSWCVKQPIGGPSFGSPLYLRGQGREENMKQQVGRVLPLKHIQKRIYDSLTMLKWLNILSEMVEHIEWNGWIYWLNRQ